MVASHAAFAAAVVENANAAHAASTRATHEDDRETMHGAPGFEP